MPTPPDPDRPVAAQRQLISTSIELDQAALRAVMARFRFADPSDAVNFALTRLAGDADRLGQAPSLEDPRRMRGSGWEGELEMMRDARDE